MIEVVTMEQWKKVACKNWVGNLKAKNKKIKKKKKIQSKCTLGLVNMGTSTYIFQTKI